MWMLTGDVLLLPVDPGGPAAAGSGHLGLASRAPPLPVPVRDIEAVLGLGGRGRRRRRQRLFSFGCCGFSSLLVGSPGGWVLLRLGPEWRDVNRLLTVKVKIVVEAQRGVGLVSRRRRSGPRGPAVTALGSGPGFGVLPGLLHRADLRAPSPLLFPRRGLGFATRLLVGPFPGCTLLGLPGWGSLRRGVADLLLGNSRHRVGIPADGTGRNQVQLTDQASLLDAVRPPPAAPSVSQAPSHGHRGRQGDQVTRAGGQILLRRLWGCTGK